MDFNIYVLGDVRLFADTFNGIAMMFTVANGERIDMWASNTNSMGLGMGAFLGLLIAICTMIYNAAFRQKFDMASLMLPLILYICLTVPKVTVNIVDGYYRDGAQTVDNVPIGLALPLSAISSISFAATEKLETVFTVPNNGTYTKITEDGFVMPIKLLHSLRYTGLTMRDGYPNVTKSLAEIMKICLTNNPSFNMKDYQNSSDSIGTIVTALTDVNAGARLIKIYPHDKKNGEVVSCSRAGQYIRGTLRAYMDGTVGEGIPTLISSDMVKQKNFKTDVEKILSSQSANTGSRNLTDTSTLRILDDIQNMTKASNDEAINFIQASILNPQLASVAECVDGADNAHIARCLSYKGSEEQWKERSAAEASGFLSIMKDGQNLLILLSITLFPIMVLVIAMQGMGGLKVVGSYFLYTISAYLWIPVAAMINWYVQLQLHEELEKWASRLPVGIGSSQGFLSLANAPLFYDAISKRLAIANTVMAAVPLICMGLFSGMLWSMNRLADKMNPQSNFDPSVNTPPVVERSPIANVGNSISFDGLNSVGKMNTLPDMSVLSNVRERAESIKRAETHLQNASESAAKALGERVALSKDNSEAHSLAEKALEQHGFTKENSESYEKGKTAMLQSMAAFGLAHSVGQQTEITSSQAESAAKTLGYDLTASLSKNPLALSAALRLRGSELYDSALSTKNSTGTEASLSESTTGMNSAYEKATSKQSKSSAYSATSSMVGLAASATKSSESLTNSLNESQTYRDNVASAQTEMNNYSQQNRQADTVSIETSKLANLDEATGGAFSSAMNHVYSKYGNEEGVSSRYNENRGEFANTSGASTNNFLRQFDALNNGSPEAKAAAYKALGAVGDRLAGGMNGNHIPDVSGDTAGVYDKARAKAADSWNVKAPDTSIAGINSQGRSLEGQTNARIDDVTDKSKQQAAPQGEVPDVVSPIKKTGREYMDDNKRAYNEGIAAIRYPDRNLDGDPSRYTQNMNAAGSMYAGAGEGGNQHYFDMNELAKLNKKENSGQTLTPQENQLRNEILDRDDKRGFVEGLVVNTRGKLAMVADKLEDWGVVDKGFNEESMKIETGIKNSKNMSGGEFYDVKNATGAKGTWSATPIDTDTLQKSLNNLNESMEDGFNKRGR